MSSIAALSCSGCVRLGSKVIVPFSSFSDTAMDRTPVAWEILPSMDWTQELQVIPTIQMVTVCVELKTSPWSAVNKVASKPMSSILSFSSSCVTRRGWYTISAAASWSETWICETPDKGPMCPSMDCTQDWQCIPFTPIRTADSTLNPIAWSSRTISLVVITEVS